MSSAQEQEWIVIRGWGSLSGLGSTSEEVGTAFMAGKNTFTTLPHLGTDAPVSPLSISGEQAVRALQLENPAYASLDRSVLMAMVAARQAVARAGWHTSPEISVGVNIGSSRGATGLFEQYHQEFLQHPQQRLSPGTSPSTTLGNLASWVAYDLNAAGPALSHSVTCSTSLQAFANGVAWLKAGMAKRFLVGGTEAPLTPFTLAQMQAIGIYTKYKADQNPCRPLNLEGQNTFTLGEGAAVFALERLTTREIQSLPPGPTYVVAGVGTGFERSPSKTGLSPDGLHFQQAMRAALEHAQLSSSQIGCLAVHAPGTRVGDAAELAAIQAVFGLQPLPPFFSNKGLIGHTLGASGALTVAHFLDLSSQNQPLFTLNKNIFNSNSYSSYHILFSSAGFGGNSASLIIKKVTL